MTAPKPEVPPAPEVEVRTAPIGRVVFYHPPEHQARYAPGPWAALITKINADDVATLAVFPPTPTPVGTDPVARVEGVPYSESKLRTPGTWSRA